MRRREVVVSMMHIPPCLRSRRLQDRLQCHVRRSLVQRTSLRCQLLRARGLQLWNTVGATPATLVPAPRRRCGARITTDGRYWYFLTSPLVARIA
jgi:hypothetical protein